MSEPDWPPSWERGTAFTVGITAGGRFGNGLAVDARTVVTCAHVVCDRATFDELDGEPDPDWSGIGYAWDRQRWSIEIWKANDSVRVRRVRIHRSLDLAVLDLERPLPGRRAPMWQAPGALHGRAAWVPLMMAEGGPGLCAIPALPVQFSLSTLRRVTVKVDLGLPEGASGSGIFVESDGMPVFAALAERGGVQSAIGRFIPAAAVLTFLAECGWAPAGGPSERMTRTLWADGVCAAPFTCILPGERPADFVPLGIVDDARVWIARDPVLNLSAGADRPGHPLDRATDLTRDEARAIIAQFDQSGGLAAGLRPRLPTVAEMMRAHAVASGRVDLPGPDEAEWVDDPGIAALRHDPRSRPPFTPVHDGRRSSAIGFRLVLEETLP